VSSPTRDAIAAALARHAHVRVEGGARRAAVALVLREAQGGGLELLFMLRAENEHDPWSGHVSFPGGRTEPQDAGPQETAVRETLEETGLDLARDAEPLGALDEVRALARGRPVDMVISPFVFALRHERTASPSDEVVSLHWIRLPELLSPGAQSTLEYSPAEGIVVALPCLRIGGLVIWGLTYRMFQNLVSLLP
jgi:8-oxo-dGTP pyrophosphatase MutT (NUDIX family)